MAVRDIFGAVLLLFVSSVWGQASTGGAATTGGATSTAASTTTTTTTTSTAATTAAATTTTTTTTTTTITGDGNVTTKATMKGDGNVTTTTTMMGTGTGSGVDLSTTTTIPPTTKDPNATTIAVAATDTVKRSYVLLGTVNTGGYDTDGWFAMVLAVTVEPGMSFIAICVSEFENALVTAGGGSDVVGGGYVSCAIVKASRQRRGRRLAEASVQYNMDVTMPQSKMSKVSTDGTALGASFGETFQKKVIAESGPTGTLGSNPEWTEKYGDGSNFTTAVTSTSSTDVIVTTAAPAPPATTSGANMIFVTMGTAMTLFMGMLI